MNIWGLLVLPPSLPLLSFLPRWNIKLIKLDHQTILCRGGLRSFACSFILNWSCLCWMIKRQTFLGFRATSPSSSSSSWLVLRRDELLWLAGGHQVVWTSYDKKVFSQHHLSPGIPTLRRSARPTGDFWVSLKQNVEIPAFQESRGKMASWQTPGGGGEEKSRADFHARCCWIRG